MTEPQKFTIVDTNTGSHSGKNSFNYNSGFIISSAEANASSVMNITSNSVSAAKAQLSITSGSSSYESFFSENIAVYQREPTFIHSSGNNKIK